MNVLLIGSGGREHALAWALSASPLLTSSTARRATPASPRSPTCVALDVADHAAVVRFCAEQRNRLRRGGTRGAAGGRHRRRPAAAKIKVFGPSKAAAQLEGSKGFTKDLCREFSIPTGAYGRFTDARSAKAYLAAQKLPIVIKADGLAAGKGVVIAETKAAGGRGRRRLLRRRVRGRGRRGRDRGVPGGRGGELLCPCRRRARAAPRHGAGPQARRRRRHRPQHRRHGRLFAGARDDARDDAPHDRRDHQPDGARHGGARHALQGRAVPRRHDHQGRPQALRVQRALRRPRVPGARCCASSPTCWRR